MAVTVVYIIHTHTHTKKHTHTHTHTHTYIHIYIRERENESPLGQFEIPARDGMIWLSRWKRVSRIMTLTDCSPGALPPNRYDQYAPSMRMRWRVSLSLRIGV